jgi:hypothetical protein
VPIVAEGEPARRMRGLLSVPDGSANPSAVRTSTMPELAPDPVEVITRRRAVRRFASAAPSTVDVVAALRAGFAARPGFVVFVLARRLGAVDPGTYVAFADGSLTRAQQQIPDTVTRLYADAPFTLFVCADLGSATTAHGINGYSRTLTDAAAFTYAAWLSLVARGLAGCVYGGTHHEVDRVARRLAAVRHVFTFSGGVPVTDDGTPGAGTDATRAARSS